MNDRAEGMIEGLGIAIILTRKYQKNTTRLLQALAKVTERIQTEVACNRLVVELNIGKVIPDLKDIHKPD